MADAKFQVIENCLFGNIPKLLLEPNLIANFKNILSYSCILFNVLIIGLFNGYSCKMSRLPSSGRSEGEEFSHSADQ